MELPAHKRILSYDISLEPLPRTTTGKMRRFELQRRVREQAAATGASGHPARAAGESAWRAAGGLMAKRSDVIARRLDAPTVRPDANLELDLGLDSMERVELLTLLEQRAGHARAADARATVFTVRQLVEAGWRRAPADVPATAEAPRAPRPDRAAVGGAPRDALAPGDHCRPLKPKWATAIFYYVRRADRARAAAIPASACAGANLPKQGPFLVCPNHQTYLDGFFLAAALPFRAFRQHLLRRRGRVLRDAADARPRARAST